MPTKILKYSIALFILVFAIYFFTLSHEVNWRDSGELITSAFTLSIAHPPGYPLFLLIAKVFTFLPLPGFLSTAFKLNFMSAFFSALAAVCLFNILEKVFNFINNENHLSLSFLITLLFSLSTTLWYSSVTTTSYTLNLFLVLLLSFILVNIFWENKFHYQTLFFFLLGVGLCNHYTIIAVFIIYIVFFIKDKFWHHLKLIDYFKFMLFLLLGLSIYLYLPIRSLSNPVINWGNPSNVNNFLAVVFRQQYGDIFNHINILKDLIQQLSVINPIYEFMANSQENILMKNIIYLLLSLGCIYFLILGIKFLKPKQIYLFFLLLFLCFTLPLILVISTSIDKLYTLKVFFIPGWVGFYVLLFTGIYSKFKKTFVYLGLSIFIALFLINYGVQNKAHYLYTKDYATSILNNTTYRSIFFTLKDNETFPLWYYKYVQYKRKDLIVLNLVLLSEKWYLNQIQKEYPALKINLSYLKGLFKKEEIRKAFVSSILQSNPDKDIYFSTKKFQSYLSLNLDLNSVGSIYKYNDFHILETPDVFVYNNLEKDYKSFQDYFFLLRNKEYQKKVKYIDMQTKYMMQEQALCLNEYADNLQKSCLLKAAQNYYQYVIYLNQLIGIGINNIYSLENLGNISFVNGDIYKSVYYYQQAINLQPNTVFAKSLSQKIFKISNREKNEILLLLKQAESFYKNRNYDKAIMLYLIALKNDPDEVMIYSNIGDCYYNNRNYQKAIEYYLQAIEHKSNYTPAYNNLGGVYLMTGEKNKALLTWKKGLQFDPNNQSLKNTILKYQ